MHNTRTEAQARASRSNGAKSEGPKTAEGKARSSQNSTKHGLYSTRIVLANESQEIFDALYMASVHEWNPVGEAESQLVYDMVAARWKMNRFESMEAAALDSEIYAQQVNFEACFETHDPAMRQADAVMSLHVSNPGLLEYYSRAHARLFRLYTRARNDLERLQTRRLGHVPKRNVPVPQPVAENLQNEPEPQPSVGFSHNTNYVEPEVFTRFC